jgi:hypothetical protein
MQPTPGSQPTDRGARDLLVVRNGSDALTIDRAAQDPLKRRAACAGGHKLKRGGLSPGKQFSDPNLSDWSAVSVTSYRYSPHCRLNGLGVTHQAMSENATCREVRSSFFPCLVSLSRNV